MKKIVVLTAITAILFGCNHAPLEITSQYIINGGWQVEGQEYGGNHINIYRMKLLPDSTIDVHAGPGQLELLRKLQEDSSFQVEANVQVKGIHNYNKQKIFFNSDNGFKWSSTASKEPVTVIGNLQPDTWYHFMPSNTFGWTFMVYVDSASATYSFNINQSNF